MPMVSADKPADSGDRREKLGLLRDEENHVGAVARAPALAASSK